MEEAIVVRGCGKGERYLPTVVTLVVSAEQPMLKTTQLCMEAGGWMR